MTVDPIRGKSLRWTFEDGVMKGKTFEHVFGADGVVAFRCEGDDTMTGSARYELARVSDNVYAVSYLVPQGYTLTTILDTKTGKLVAFSSNTLELAQQHGSFEAGGRGKDHRVGAG